MDEVFKSDVSENIDSIVFNGYIEDIDLATGQDIKPYVISAMVDKVEFNKVYIYQWSIVVYTLDALI